MFEPYLGYSIKSDLELINRTVVGSESADLPYYSVLFNRAPALNLTGFKGEVVILNTSASSPA